MSCHISSSMSRLNKWSMSMGFGGTAPPGAFLSWLSWARSVHNLLYVFANFWMVSSQCLTADSTWACNFCSITRLTTIEDGITRRIYHSFDTELLAQTNQTQTSVGMIYVKSVSWLPMCSSASWCRGSWENLAAFSAQLLPGCSQHLKSFLSTHSVFSNHLSTCF